jgi:hypothetical protein
MSLTLKSSFVIALSLVAATSASAADPFRPILAPGVNGGYGYGYFVGTGTTAHESINRGRATLIRSIGERHVLDEQARNIREESIARRLDNVMKAQQTRIAMRRVGEAEQNLKFEKLHARRLTTMAINEAYRVHNAGGSTPLETRAQARLRLARQLLENERPEEAANWLQNISDEYANTAAAEKASQILDGSES